MAAGSITCPSTDLAASVAEQEQGRGDRLAHGRSPRARGAAFLAPAPAAAPAAAGVVAPQAGGFGSSRAPGRCSVRGTRRAPPQVAVVLSLQRLASDLRLRSPSPYSLTAAPGLTFVRSLDNIEKLPHNVGRRHCATARLAARLRKKLRRAVDRALPQLPAEEPSAARGVVMLHRPVLRFPWPPGHRTPTPDGASPMRGRTVRCSLGVRFTPSASRRPLGRRQPSQRKCHS
jgi:hypothetical protein